MRTRTRFMWSLLVCFLISCPALWGSSSSSSDGVYVRYGSEIGNTRGRTQDTYVLKHKVYTVNKFQESIRSLGSSGGSSGFRSSGYQSSDVPKWDIQYSVGGGFEDSDFQITPFGTRLDTDVWTMRAGVNATKDRFVVLTDFHHEMSEGKGTMDGIDARTTGVSIMPGYELWTQEENGLQVALFGILDIGYSNGKTNVPFTSAPNQWRMSPGAGMSLGYAANVGVFQAGYTYHNSRNLDGDLEASGRRYMDIHNIGGMYAMPLSTTLVSSFGIDYTAVEDMPNGIADDFTHAQIGLATHSLQNWHISANYYESIDSSDTRGVNASVAFMW
jgi:hypothetical protein